MFCFRKAKITDIEKEPKYLTENFYGHSKLVTEELVCF